MNEQAQRLVRCFAAVFPDLDEEELDRAAVSSVGAWDSLATVTLISVVEEEFEVVVDPQDVELFVSVRHGSLARRA